MKYVKQVQNKVQMQASTHTRDYSKQTVVTLNAIFDFNAPKNEKYNLFNMSKCCAPWSAIAKIALEECGKTSQYFLFVFVFLQMINAALNLVYQAILSISIIYA